MAPDQPILVCGQTYQANKALYNFTAMPLQAHVAGQQRRYTVFALLTQKAQEEGGRKGHGTLSIDVSSGGGRDVDGVTCSERQHICQYILG